MTATVPFADTPAIVLAPDIGALLANDVVRRSYWQVALLSPDTEQPLMDQRGISDGS